MSGEDTKVVDIFDKDIENFGNDLEKMIEHLNIVIATHNKQVDEIERLHSIIKEAREYIEEHTENVELNIYGMPPVIRTFRGNTQTLLEILDKV